MTHDSAPAIRRALGKTERGFLSWHEATWRTKKTTRTRGCSDVFDFDDRSTPERVGPTYTLMRSGMSVRNQRPDGLTKKQRRNNRKATCKS